MITSITRWLSEVPTWLGGVFTGPLGGIIGGAISFIALEMGYKKRRERNGIAEALAAELAGIARQLDAFIADEDKHEIPMYNRMPTAWRERTSNALSLHPDHPVRQSELKTLEEGRVGFYGLATKVRIDCRGLATHLRTKYAMGWRSLIPLRLRPTLRVPSGNAAA